MTCTATRHDNYIAYRRHGCRCTPARRDHRRRQKHQRAGHIPPQLIDGTGTRRRLQALSALGHTTTHIGALTGRHNNFLCAVMRGRHPLVHVGTAADIKAVYNALSHIPGASVITRARATRKGWPPPLAWDDDQIDDPDAHPNDHDSSDDGIDEIAVALACERVNRPHRPEDERRIAALTEAERDEVIRRLHGRGHTDTEIAHALGTVKSTVTWRRRHHLGLSADRAGAA